jgi:PadR family transcriptional regulator
MMRRSLTEQTLFILASLARAELHGYGIARDVEELSDGRVRLTAGTLYGALNRLTAEGLITQSRERVVEGRRRRYYRLTGAGQTVLAEEAARLRSTAAALSARSEIAPARRPRPA